MSWTKFFSDGLIRKIFCVELHNIHCYMLNCYLSMHAYRLGSTQQRLLSLLQNEQISFINNNMQKTNKETKGEPGRKWLYVQLDMKRYKRLCVSCVYSVW